VPRTYSRAELGALEALAKERGAKGLAFEPKHFTGGCEGEPVEARIRCRKRQNSRRFSFQYG